MELHSLDPVQDAMMKQRRTLEMRSLDSTGYRNSLPTPRDEYRIIFILFLIRREHTCKPQ